MDSFIYDFFGINNSTRTWWLSPGQSFVSDFLIPIIASVVIGGITIYYAKKSYLLEKKLADLQIFHGKLFIYKMPVDNVGGENYMIIVKFVNQSNISGFIDHSFFFLGENRVAIGGSYSVLRDLHYAGEIGGQDTVSSDIGYNVLKKYVKIARNGDNDSILKLVVYDTCENTYEYIFEKEKFPELYE